MTKDPKARYVELLTTLGKRPRTVLEIILRKGEVSTYELGQLGYDQPPRAAQDLKEHGVRLKTRFDKHPETNARMAIYMLADDSDEVSGSFTGRVAFPKKFREELLDHFKYRCNICNTEYNGRSLQLDHRVPYILGGEANQFRIADFQTLCNSHQRAKSWECEHCNNRISADAKVCANCYWAIPDGPYQHVAMREERRLDLTFVGAEASVYKSLQTRAKRENKAVSAVAKEAIKKGIT
jgi:hypothetical protein